MNKKASVLMMSVMILLAACSANQTSPAATTSSTPATVATISPSPTPTATPVSTPTPTASTPAPEVVKKTYHMNKNYDIVPNDPTGNKKIVLLTFDDGPKEQAMNQALIDILKKHNAKAIFFLNGYRIKQKPELVKLLYSSGNIIGNHAWDHDNLKSMTNEKIDQQVDDVQKIVKELTGQSPVFFRPPYGSGNDYLKTKVKDNKMLYMTWSNGSLDWDMTNKNNDSGKVIENVMKQLHDGSNILMHELPWTVKALDTLLTQLEEKGYSFVDPNAIELEMK
ncbi:polysaccharide deacetylase family protein [Paenibacillus alginolyticus]|uniref:Polysaccharide deacetylase family protein n=1 Tax=Paenibacillus alginolyticus TaxID=59839 RepID=A0ABT4GD07_9BACL|nr:polysaccharide deacetylase family protein [Paenibacillus alginolyticus]MCY9664742.1 polysaccharide deacetylase family protein [Paenibacillus alginolyticus]MCY9694060.1 polysaccharide deacetylase family protein [Paenibacillus alginolyticus]MEC0143518.1 polysaccharide deacetylase family protein [Paenibacillus alginolyticus]